MLPISKSFSVIPKFELIKKVLKNKNLENLNIADLCCGSGYVAEFLKNQNIKFRNYLGLDIDQETINNAKKYFEKDNNINFDRIDISKNRSENYLNKFNLVFFLDGIEHIENDVVAIKFANDILHEKGELILTTPHLKGIFTRNISTYLHDSGPMNNEREGYFKEEIIKKVEKFFHKKQVKECNFFFAELFIFISKLGYRLVKKKYNSQADLESVKDTYLFNIYSIILKLIKTPILILDNILGKLSSGHCLFIHAIKK